MSSNFNRFGSRNIIPNLLGRLLPWLMLISVMLVDNLPFPVVLGENLPILYDLIQPTKTCEVLTRAQSMLKVFFHLLSVNCLYAERETTPRKS